MPPKERKTGATARRKESNGAADQGVAQSPDKYAATSWGGSAYEDLDLPSGQLCLARKAGVQGLLESGIIHEIDPLMSLVQQHQDRVEGKPSPTDENTIMNMLKDESKVASLMHMLDRIVCHVVVKPHVEMAPNDITRRKPDVIYTDMVDFMDKMFIMTWTVGGAETVAGFRKEYEELVGGISAVPEDGGKSE